MNVLLLVFAINMLHPPANGWISYTITTRESVRISSCSHCTLGDDNSFSTDSTSGADTHAQLFVRFQNGVADRVRLFPANCSVDTAGQTVQHVDSVAPEASVAFLRDVVAHGEKRARNGALLALSMEDGATDALIDIARNNPDRDVRGSALFWLSQQAGRKAAAALKDAVDNDPEESVRGKAVFGIAQLPNDQSIPMLADLMKNNHSKEVRRKAAFWLGQKNDPRALAAIEDLLMH